jgi:hypothetical protein
MKYKIYRLRNIAVDLGGITREVIEDATFDNEIFDTIEDAYSQIQQRGDIYCNYTILPYISLSKLQNIKS